MTFHLELLTPEKVIYKDDVDEVTLPTIDGQITILPNHVNLLTQLATGELTVKKGSESHHVAINGGFVEVANNTVSIITDYAIRSDDIVEAKAEEARERAKKRMEERTSEVDFAQAESEFKRALLELHVAQRRKRRSGQ